MRQYAYTCNNVTKMATQTLNLSFSMLKGFIADLIGDAGYEASAQDLLELMVPSSQIGTFEKVVVNITSDETPCINFTICKIGPVHRLSILKKNGVEFHSRSATTLINLVKNFQPSPESVKLDSLKGKNLVKLQEALSKAEKAKGRHASVRDVFHFLLPDVYMGVGRYTHRIPNYDLRFNTVLRTMVVEIVDSNGFTKAVTNARELRGVIS